MGDLAKCLAVTLEFEGGKVDDPRDMGGRTNEGVTQRVYDAWRRKQGQALRDVYLMASPERDAIYRDGYWAPIYGDTLPDGVDLAAFDYAVNSGAGTAWKAIKAMQNLPPVDAVKAICARRLSLLQSLANWSVYGKGWGARVAKVQALGIAWAAGPSAAKSELTKAASEETAKAKTKAKGAAGSVIAAGSAGTAQVATGGHWALILGVVALAAIGVVLFFSIRKHQDAAAALAEAAKGA